METARCCPPVLQSIFVLCGFAWGLPGCSSREDDAINGESSPDAPEMEMISAPGLENAPVIGPLADAW